MNRTESGAFWEFFKQPIYYYHTRQKRRIENRIKEKEEKMKGVVTNQQDDSSVLPDAVKPTKASNKKMLIYNYLHHILWF